MGITVNSFQTGRVLTAFEQAAHSIDDAIWFIK
jgi:hypothetical protein